MLILILCDTVLALVQANARKTFEETLEAHVRMTRDLVRTDLVRESLFFCLCYFQGMQYHGYMYDVRDLLLGFCYFSSVKVYCGKLLEKLQIILYC